MPALELRTFNTVEYLDLTQADEAMRRYWEACQAGDDSASLKRVALVPTPDPEEDPPPSTPAGAISPVAVERIERHESWLSKAGFTLAPPLYAPGTRVIDLGDQNFSIERRRVEALPTFPSAADQVIATVQAEDRQDLTLALSEVRMDDRGALVCDEGRFWLEPDAFGQLAHLGGFGCAVRYLTDLCDPVLRAENFNRQVERRSDRELVLRTRLRGDARTVFAAVTPTYSAVDTDRVLEVAKAGLADSRVELRYDGSGIRGTALWMPDEIVDLAAGDVFKVGVRIESDDTGRGRIRVSGVAFRNRCLNLIIIGEGEVQTVSAVHRGDPERIVASVREGVEEARAKIGDFLNAWGHARTVKVEVPSLLEEWVQERKLQLPGVRSAGQRDAVVQAMLDAWAKEPGDTLADAVNAVTRSAHEQIDWNLDLREALEKQASRLVLVPA